MACEHLETNDNAPARTDGCEECLQSGDRWVHLRRSALRPRRLLRLVEEQTRHEALPVDDPSGHPVVRKRGRLEVVLRRQNGSVTGSGLRFSGFPQ